MLTSSDFSFLDYYLWEPHIYALQIDGLQLKWYSVLFALSFFIGRLVLVRIYKLEQRPSSTVDAQLLFASLGTLIGARAGHVIWYQPSLLKTDFLEIFKFWHPGLSSHGAALGILLSMGIYIYCTDQKWTHTLVSNGVQKREGFFTMMDRVVIVVALGAVFIRVGNFVNSEIIGKPTNSDFGVVFLNPFSDDIKDQLPFVTHVDYCRINDSSIKGLCPLEVTIQFKSERYFEERIRTGVDKLLISSIPTSAGNYAHIINPMGAKMEYSFLRSRDSFALRFHAMGIARHPAQLYEAMSSLFLFLFLLVIWYKRRGKIPPGTLLGWFMVLLFSLRFVHEFFKENQTSFENEMVLNMGQLLSLPYMIFGFILLFSNRNPHHRVQKF